MEAVPGLINSASSVTKNPTLHVQCVSEVLNPSVLRNRRAAGVQITDLTTFTGNRSFSEVLS